MQVATGKSNSEGEARRKAESGCGAEEESGVLVHGGEREGGERPRAQPETWAQVEEGPGGPSARWREGRAGTARGGVPRCSDPRPFSGRVGIHLRAANQCSGILK